MVNPIKTFLFLRWLPSDGEWGGMEKLMLEWFERIDYNQAKVTLAVTPGWKERFESEIKKKKLLVSVIEFPFEFTHQKFLRFKYFYSFFKNLNPSSIIFVQGLHTEFHLGDVVAASWITKGNVFMHENLGASAPIEKTSRLYFGFIRGFALWWHMERSYINLRAYFCKYILVVSESIQNRLVELWKYPKNKVLVTYHGVAPDKFKSSVSIRSKMRAQLSLDSSTPVIIVTARLTLQKRLDRLIEAFDKVVKEFKVVQLFIAGSGPLENQLKELAQSKPCASQIHFLGQVTNVADCLQMADFYVLSSDNEGLSIALMEAMASGLVCVSTNCPGSEEVIENAKNGYLVPMSVEGVHQGLQQALSLPLEQRVSMAQKARDTIKERFNIDENIKNIFEIMGIPFYGA
jgi:glycosyltransferase involved in cell wall biosynthesis